MTDRPIIMSTESVKAILDGKKTMTRRVIKPQPDLLYGIYDDIIQLYHNRRVEDDRVDIKTNTNIPKRQLYGWERWQDLLTNQIQRLRQEGFRGVVSISRLQDREEGIFSCLLMPRQQAGNDVSSSASMYGFSRHTPSKINASEAFGWQPAKQQALQSQVGDSIRELARQNTPQQKQSELQQSEFTNNASRERAYPLGGQEGHSQQATHLQSIRNEPTFHIRNMPWSIGQRLWVRETHYIDLPMNDGSLRAIFKDGSEKFNTGQYIKEFCNVDGLKWKPSIHMPRWASRITLEITEVRVERIQDISANDVKAEGASWDFYLLWDSLNAKRGYGWEVNPWVWVISFKKEQKDE